MAQMLKTPPRIRQTKAQIPASSASYLNIRDLSQIGVISDFGLLSAALKWV
jgi:hypothetical protein